MAHATPDDPEGLGHEGGAEHADGPLAREGGQARRVLAERDHDAALDQDRRADGHDDEVQHIGVAMGRMMRRSMRTPTAVTAATVTSDDHGQGQARRGEDGRAEHAAEHGELALGEVHRAGGVEHDVEPERDEAVDRPHHEAGEEELQQARRAHTRLRRVQLICRRPA